MRLLCWLADIRTNPVWKGVVFFLHSFHSTAVPLSRKATINYNIDANSYFYFSNLLCARLFLSCFVLFVLFGWVFSGISKTPLFPSSGLIINSSDKTPWSVLSIPLCFQKLPIRNNMDGNSDIVNALTPQQSPERFENHPRILRIWAASQKITRFRREQMKLRKGILKEAREFQHKNQSPKNPKNSQTIIAGIINHN